MLFMNKLDFSYFADFLQGFLKADECLVFFISVSTVEGTVISTSKILECFVKFKSRNSISD